MSEKVKWTDEAELQFCKTCLELIDSRKMKRGMRTLSDLALVDVQQIYEKLRKDLFTTTQRTFSNNSLDTKWYKLRTYYRLVLARDSVKTGIPKEWIRKVKVLL
jgi:hypothetical protein